MSGVILWRQDEFGRWRKRGRGGQDRGVVDMGEQVRELFNWARRRKILAAVFVAFTLTVGILIGSVVSGRVSAMKSLGFSGTTATALTVPDPIPSSSSFAAIVNRVEPAVVNIATTQVLERKQSKKRRAQPYDQDDPMQDFFDRFFDGRPDGPPQAERSLGSGVIVDKRGYILTNNHVVEQATKIQVQLNGETTRYTAKVIGVDEDTDLAVIKIDASKDLPIAKLGNSDGPLVDLAGEVIGINTAIITGSRGYEGVGFALPSTTAINVYDQIIKQGRVTRGSIGVSFQEELGTNPITLKSLGAPYGVAIEGVQPGSPAEKAGLKGGDVITSVNGRPVKTGNDLVNPIAQAPIGSKIKIEYVRQNQKGEPEKREAAAVVEDRARVFPNVAGRMGDQPGEAAPSEFGLHVEELTPERGHRVGVEGQKGVLVTEVDPASFAEDLGFGRGDVIAEINREQVNSVSDYRKAVSRLKQGQDVVFKVLRRQDSDRILTLYLSGKVPADNQQ